MATAQNDTGEAKSEQFPSKQPSSGQDSKTGWSLKLLLRSDPDFHHVLVDSHEWQHTDYVILFHIN